jgi:integrase
MAHDTTEQDVERRIKTFEQQDFVSDRNAELVRDFIDYLQSHKDKAGYWRQKMYISKFSVSLREYMDEEVYDETDFDKLTYKDMNRLIAGLGRDKADRTLNAYKSCFRMFYKQLYILEEDRPKRVRRMFKTEIIKHDSNPEDEKVKNFFDSDEIWKLVEVARNPRDACLPALGFDAGARTEEMNALSIGDIQMNQSGVDGEFIDCKNDKDNRILPLTHCVEQVRNWLNNHPRADEPDAPFWCKIRDYGERNRGDAVSQKSLNDICKKLARRAKEKYPDQFEWLDPSTVTVYDFRHSSIDFRKIQKDYGAGRLMWWYAWKNPDMISHYGEDANDKYNKAVKEEEGVEVDEEEFSHSMQRKECPRCEEERSPDASYCPSCSLPVETETAIKDSVLRDAGREIIEAKLDGKADGDDIRELVEEVKQEV